MFCQLRACRDGDRSSFIPEKLRFVPASTGSNLVQSCAPIAQVIFLQTLKKSIKIAQLLLWLFGSLTFASLAFSKPLQLDSVLYVVDSIKNPIHMEVVSSKERSNVVRIRFEQDLELPDIKEEIFVLDLEKKNIIAAIAVKRISKKSRRITGILVKLLATATKESLFGKYVVRLTDFSVAPSILVPDNPKKNLVATKIPRPIRNPLIEIGAGVTSFRFTSADVLTGSVLNARLSAATLSTELFLPRIDAAPWINWLGLKLEVENYQTGTVSFQSKDRQEVQLSEIDGQVQMVFFVFKPGVQWTIPASLQLEYGIFQERTDTISLQKTELAEESNLSMRVSGSQLALGFEVDVRDFLKISLRYCGLPAQTYKASEALSGASQTGSWKREDIETRAKFEFPLTNSRMFYAYGLAGFVYRTDTISGPVIAGESSTSIFTDSIFKFSAGLGLSI
jgi:hypothetical protein